MILPAARLQDTAMYFHYNNRSLMHRSRIREHIRPTAARYVGTRLMVAKLCTDIQVSPINPTGNVATWLNSLMFLGDHTYTTSYTNIATDYNIDPRSYQNSRMKAICAIVFTCSRSYRLMIYKAVPQLNLAINKFVSLPLLRLQRIAGPTHCIRHFVVRV
jgi:hypothetical protein